MAIIGLCTQVFYIPEQTAPEKRTKKFKRSEELLLTSGDSVYLTPEGSRNKSNCLQKFNKGAFHMATNLKLPIVSLFIDSPEKCNPHLKLMAQPGTIYVHLIDITDTSDWKIEDLDQNREMIWEKYWLRQKFHTNLRSTLAIYEADKFL